MNAFRETTTVDLSGSAPALMRIRDAVVRAKIALSQTRTVSLTVPFVTSRGGQTLDLDVTLTRTRSNELTGELVARSLRLSADALEDAGYSSGTIDHALVVGRAARESGVPMALKDLFGSRLTIAPDRLSRWARPFKVPFSVDITTRHCCWNHSPTL